MESSPPEIKIDRAIQELIKSCRVLLPDGSNGQSQSLPFNDVQDACDELLKLPFHSEDGRLQVIEKLTKLEGNFVVKIIRKGLVSLSKVYHDSKTFEEESLDLVDLCCSQAEVLRNGCGHQSASPAVIIDWTVVLCDELLKPRTEEGVSSGPPTVLMSRCLSKLRDIYEIFVRSRIFLDSTNISGAPVSIGNFKVLFETLIPRIQQEGFEELIEQTLAVIKTDENLDFLKFSRFRGLKQAIILTSWKDLLKVPFLRNWFVIKVAKHDFLVHDDSYAKSLPFSDFMTYTESLICQVASFMSSLVAEKEKEFSCSIDKARMFFEYPEVLLRHTSLCFQLMQANDISTNLIKELFCLLGIKFDRTLLPFPAHSDVQDYDFKISPDTNSMNAQIKSLREQSQRKCALKLASERKEEKSSLDTITKALLTLPDQQQVLNIVRLWRKHFPDDKSYVMLSQLLVQVKVVMEGEKDSISDNMERLVNFLSRDLPTECLRNLSLWQPLMVRLIPLLPSSWDGPEVVSLITRFLELHVRSTDLVETADNRSTGVADKLRHIPTFVLNSLQGASRSEEVKIDLLKLALELFEEVPQLEEYKFALNVIHSVSSGMEISGIKTFTLSLLKTAKVHVPRMHYLEIWKVISLIDQSSSIRSKSEVFQSYLKFLQEINQDVIIEAVNTCSSFLQIPVAVNADNLRRVFSVAATNAHGLKSCKFILECLKFNSTILVEESRIDKHINFLFSIVERTLCGENLELFFEAVYRYMQLRILYFPNIDVFEIMLASIAGCIAVDRFDINRFAAVLKVVQAAASTHRLNQPNALCLTIHVSETIERFRKTAGFVDEFANGLCPVAKLPLKLKQIIKLMEDVTSILDQQNIRNVQKLFNVMFHLFQLPRNESVLSLDSEALDQHFKEVVNERIIRSAAEIPLMQKKDTTGEVSLFSLMEALVERMPETLTNKTLSSLYQFIIERVDSNRQLSTTIFPIVEAITKRRVSEAKLKEEVEEIEEMLLRLPPGFIPLIGECLRECHVVGLVGEEWSIKCLITLILECLQRCHLNVEDGCRMMSSILDIPKQLVLTFKEATSPDEARVGMMRIFDVVKTLDPEFIAGNAFLLYFPQPEGNDQLENTFIQHDFYMLLKHTSLAAEDISTAMLVYSCLGPQGLLNAFNLTTNEDFNGLFKQWSSGTNQPEVPTPGNLAYVVMQHLKRVKVPDNLFKDTTKDICCTIFGNRCFSDLDSELMAMGLVRSPSPKEYLDLIFSIMKEASHLTEIQHWLKMDCLLAVQCKDVIRATCFWKAGSKSCQEAMDISTAVSETITSLRTKLFPNAFPFAKVDLTKELQVMVLVIKTYEDKDIAVKLLELLRTSTECAEACADVLRSWDKEASLLLINKITEWYKEKRQMETNLKQLNDEIRVPLQVLPFAGKAFPNSAEEVFKFLTNATTNNGPEDPMSLGRLPVWYKQMTDGGYDTQAIQSWCTRFALACSCSSDVDSLADLTPETINLLTTEANGNQIKECLFSMEATRDLQTDNDVFKRLLLLAKLLNEFACIAGQLKENLQVVQRIQEGVRDLCSNRNATNIFYKIRYNILEDLLIILFEGEKEEHEEFSRRLTSQSQLSKSLVILFRRLARSVVSRPVTFGHVKGIVSSMFHRTDRQYQEIKNASHLEVLHFESNQDAIHTLQAAGYNQSGSEGEDLWYSSSIQMPAYVPTVESFETSRKETFLRQLWREWKAILTAHDISEVEVGGQNLKQVELFKASDSLEVMEIQLQSVQQAIQAKPLMQNDWSYYRQKMLKRKEKRLREKVVAQAKEVEEMTGTQWTKMVIVWENQLLESVKMCSEKIPDCYAPNGFHSEKPVICGIAVDNRILTLYKEDKGGTRTELENVEVKLYPAGMVVFGAYRSIHPYDTEQLWAAFYKMLLDKRLVPKIFITNVSPAFDWVKKFVTPEESSPHGINFISCCNLIPPSEDSFDYDPEGELLAYNAVFHSSQTKELIILTQENTAKLEIRSIRSPVANRKTLITTYIQEVRLQLREDRRLREMHKMSSVREKIVKRLWTPITKAVEIAVDGREPTQESISSNIDMTRLLYQCQNAHQYSKDEYCDVILDAVNTVTGDLRDSRQSYDGCHHVVFTRNIQ